MKRFLHLNAVLFSASFIFGCESQTGDSWKPTAKSANGDVPKSPAPSVAEKTGPRVFQPKVDTSDPGKPPWEGKTLADFELTERSGRKVTRADLLGKPAVVCFIFTHCRGPCQDVSVKMYELQKFLKQRNMDVQLVSISVDPKRDTTDVLQRYAKNFAADKFGWWFLTGKQQEIYKLIRSGFGQRVYEELGARPGFEVAHSTNLMLVDKAGKIIGAYNAQSPVSMAALQQRLARWKRTGSFAEQNESKRTKDNDARGAKS